MAGIGFELKKLFRSTGVFALLKAYGYTGMVTAGPMLLGVIFLLSVSYLGRYFGLVKTDQDLLVSMITYALLASLMLTSFFSMGTTRYVSDMLYQEMDDRILPSLDGVICITVPLGGIIYGIFLIFSGLPFGLGVLNFLFFTELVVVWMQMNYLSAIKDYKGIMFGYVVATIFSVSIAILLCALIEVSLISLMISVTSGYGIMVVFHYYLLYRYFENPKKGSFEFLKWFDEYSELVVIGFCMNMGLFSHLVIGWFSNVGYQIRGLFYSAPQYDVPALYAFITIIITTINFVASVEVNFYPKYRRYFDLFNGKGSISEIEKAEEEMLTILDHEITYTARKQFYGTALMLSLGLLILNKLPLGFDSLMEGYFRILCVGYGVYAIANVMMLILMYFADYEGAQKTAVVFAVFSTTFSLLSLLLNVKFYGFAFCLGSMVYFLACFKRLRYFTQKLPYHILSMQPMVYVPKEGLGVKISQKLTQIEDNFKKQFF